MLLDKIYQRDDLKKITDKLKIEGKSIAFTNGCFDILHKGHVLYLEEAKKEGDVLVVAINSDESIAKLKGPTRPVNKLSGRLTVIAALQSVDYVTYFSEDTPIETIKLLKPNVHIKAGEYDIDKMPETPFVLEYGGIVKTVKYHEAYSTTEIIKRSNT